MVGQDTEVEHIGVGKYYPASFPYLRPLGSRGITVEGGKFGGTEQVGAK